MEVGSVGEWVGGLSTTLAVLVAWRVAAVERKDRIEERQQSEREAVIRSYRGQRAAIEGVRLDIFTSKSSAQSALNDHAASTGKKIEIGESQAVLRNLSQTTISSGHIQIFLPKTADNDARFPRMKGSSTKYERVDLEHRNSSDVILLRIRQFSFMTPGKQAEVDLDGRLLTMAISIQFDFLDSAGRRWRITPASEIERVHENGFIPDETDPYFKEESRFPAARMNAFAFKSGLYSRHTGIVSGFDPEEEKKLKDEAPVLKRLAAWLKEPS